ncbi:MAG: ribosome biogenesis GTPase YlqF, partial [Clostridiales bacterium]|nr:ribosome biogenesis GTPase YlqF [Clostridiales bacterium]
LAFIGSMNDTLLNIDELSLELIRYLTEQYPGVLGERYQISEEAEAVSILEQIAQSRNCVRTGGETDYSKAAALLIEDFRSGRLGRITLELPAGSQQ